MRLHLLRHAPTRDQLQVKREAQGINVKVPIDVAEGIVVGGGEYHADCEEVLWTGQPFDGGSRSDAAGADRARRPCCF